MTGQRVLWIGNWRPAHSTENHLAASLRGLGWDVAQAQEDECVHEWDALWARAHQADLVGYTRTQSMGLPKAKAETLWRSLAAAGIPTVSYHLDKFIGLDRERFVRDRDPLFTTSRVFTADGDPHPWARWGVRHSWLRAGVLADECRPGTPNGRWAGYDVAFVGTSQRYHREWRYREQMLATLKARFGDRLLVVPRQGQPAVRGWALNDLYATVPVIVGDSLALNRERSLYWCADTETEVLTRRGWLRYDEVRRGDDAYALDPETWEGCWSPVRAVSVFPAGEREMLRMEGHRHSSLTTLDHRWITERRQKHRRPSTGATYEWVGREFRASRDLRQSDRIPLGAPCRDTPTVAKFDDSLVELVGWLWTEGSWSSAGRYTNITQSEKANPQHVARIRAALTMFVGPGVETLKRGPRDVPRWSEKRYREGMVTFAFNRALGEMLAEHTPAHIVRAEFVASLTLAQLRLFVETSIDGDGCRKTSWRNGTRSQSVSLAQKDRARLAPFEMACALLGIPTNTTEQGDVWIAHLKRRLYTTPIHTAAAGGAVAVERVMHDGEVWCPTTDAGTWLARRRGTVYFTGNSDRAYETCGRGGFLVHPRIDALREELLLCGSIRFYEWGDFDGLGDHIADLVALFRADPERRRLAVEQGSAFVREHCSYLVRMREMLDALDLPYTCPPYLPSCVG